MIKWFKTSDIPQYNLGISSSDATIGFRTTNTTRQHGGHNQSISG